MKKQIYNQALGIVIGLLTDLISGGFTTEKVRLGIIINFTYNHSNQSVEIHSNKTADMLIFLNSNYIGSCINIEEATQNIIQKFNGK